MPPADSRPPAQRPRLLAWLLALALVQPLFVGLLPVPAASAVQGEATAGTPEAAPVPEPPEISAQAAYVADVSVGRPLYALNPDERRPPASLAKMMTAVVAAEHVSPDDRVKIDPADEVDVKIFSHMGLVAGDTVTVEQLLYGMLVPSGNDAANALARHVGAALAGVDPGDAEAAVAAFVGAMNERAEALHLANTHFANPSGEDAKDQYASARDLAGLAATLMENDTLAEIVRTPEYETTSVGPERRAYGVLTNTNTLLQEEGIHGVKTGTTGEAGGNLVTAAYFSGGNRVITVILGSPYEADSETGQPVRDDRYPDTLAILESLQSDYRWLDPAERGTVEGLDEEMAAWQVTLEDGPALVVPGDRLDDLRYTLQLGPPGDPGEKVGRVLFFVGDEPVGERPVYQA